MKKYIFIVLIISFVVSVIVNFSLKNVDSFSTLIEILLISPFESFFNGYFDFVNKYILIPLFGSSVAWGVEFPKIYGIPKYFILVIVILPLALLIQLIPIIYKLIKRKIR